MDEMSDDDNGCFEEYPWYVVLWCKATGHVGSKSLQYQSDWFNGCLAGPLEPFAWIRRPRPTQGGARQGIEVLNNNNNNNNTSNNNNNNTNNTTKSSGEQEGEEEEEQEQEQEGEEAEEG